SADFSGVFREGVRLVVEEYGGRYTGCSGCGKCGARKLGYILEYPDGRRVFRCGAKLISIFGFRREDLSEFRRLMRAQAEEDAQAPQ
ncbi:MAG TPA: hypothetical protein VLA21_02485, partial [Candidatus Limnocylindria bacterium]|nr:hypothetical protein [Candidatus Limnocylindria bacterium]